MIETIIELVIELFGAIIEPSDNKKLILIILGMLVLAIVVSLFVFL